MRQTIAFIFIITTCLSFGQELPKEKLYEAKKQLRAGNDDYEKGNFSEASIAYQKSLAEDGTYYKGAYNLGNAYFQQKKYKEAIEQYQLANKLAKEKENKAKTSELIGDAFKKQKELEKALEAYKQALLKNPTDDILREKFIAAKQEKQKQDDQQKKDDQKDNKDDKNKDNKDNKGDNKDDKNKDKDNKDNKDNKDDKGEGDDKKDQDKNDQKENPEDKKDNKGDDEKKEQPQPQKSKLSPEQMEQLLESMSNEEQKTQKKVNAQKVKAKVNKNEKDW
ncbi:tetratricopeptide repeat protein [Wenyingzhuangia sp. 2_MG-2023]|uniref:tetratricopeptide repeat protein n=1 Tax=Wenyingzhuangia sp. 2_MG-2023 TaxID=3062639 RepID=UPI0026E491AD|nr:tetratricopeptide repeat protein [Wenyingzhuangia sp. 2_MG-2023]MDO6736661.1 tetratricopeptide repeat protein [Wenyingzhuangia sp. 2_MG-2023]MDO6801044.1 tetratricopeptide repeat protein [Wenyingzhuangia sp. 1_MG-2023]